VLNSRPRLVVAIIGPTGIGKTRFAIDLAIKYNGEIVNADSRQVYRFMDIGTAKPTKEQFKLVPHHLFDIVDPDEDFSLAQYQTLTCQAIRDIHQRGRLPLLVGGTGQYIWAVLEGWVVPAVPPDMEYRRFLEQQAADGKSADLYAALQKSDPDVAEKIDPHNIRRVIRAMEIIQKTDKPFSAQRLKKPPSFDFRVIGLTMERQALYARVDARVDDMVKQGFIDEVKHLTAKGYSLELPSMSGIGYREIGRYLHDEMTLEEAVGKIKNGTHRFIRHQYAWFKKSDSRIEWFDLSQENLEFSI